MKAKNRTGRRFDYLAVGFACFTNLTMVGAQKRLYNQIYGLLKNVPSSPPS
ncbi:MAG: hypothetical protein Q8Q54_10775 [Methylococcales bacterium]|nr:hypothetical protein [Methylococcales bacterium]